MKEQEAPSIDKLCTMYFSKNSKVQDKNRFEVLAAWRLQSAKHAGKMFCPKFWNSTNNDFM